GTLPSEPAVGGLATGGLPVMSLSIERVRRMSLGPSWPLLLSGDCVFSASISGVTLSFDGFGESCFACCDEALVAACFLGDLATVAVKTKKSTAARSPPPRRMNLPLLIPSAVLAALVANFLSRASSLPVESTDSCGLSDRC